MASVRDPYPFPKLQNDNNFSGHQRVQKMAYTNETHMAQKQDPWFRLNSSATLSTARREVYHFDEKAPRDSLDFILKATYNHHQEFSKDKPETLVQKETLGQDHGRILKNRVIHVPPAPLPHGHPLRRVMNPKKGCIDSVEKMIEGPHTQTTNRGFSRKPDGGLFTS